MGRLTESELSFFNAFGYLLLRQRFSPAEAREFERELLLAIERQHQRPWDGKQRVGAVLCEPYCPASVAAFEDDRLVEPARQILGAGAIGIATDGNRYVGDTGWHADHARPPHPRRGIKVICYLVPVTASTGALRVIPGSHLQPWPIPQEHEQAVRSLAIDEVPARALESEPGDAIVFDVRLWHASLGGGADRRMIDMVYYADPATPAETASFREMGDMQGRILSTFDFRSFQYSRAYLADCRRSALRSRWIERLGEIGYLQPLLEREPAATPG
jgi:hypothetical protein